MLNSFHEATLVCHHCTVTEKNGTENQTQIFLYGWLSCLFMCEGFCRHASQFLKKCILCLGGKCKHVLLPLHYTENPEA